MSLEAQLNKIMQRKQQKLDIIAEEIAYEIKRELRQLVQERWYNTYTPTSYKRTMEFINSISCEIKHEGAVVDITCGFDTSLIRAWQATDNATINNNGIKRLTWNHHMGFDGETFIDGLIELIEHGFNGRGSRLNPRRYHGGIHAIEDVQEWANHRAKELLKQKVVG